MKHKTKRVMWLVFYHGAARSTITFSLQAAWRSKRAALASIADRASDPQNYSVEKYVLAQKAK